jgi:hypothetical protein
MDKRKICLFVAHSPLTGGGGVILRSLVANLPEFDIAWHYVGDKPVKGYEDGYLGKAMMGGPFTKDVPGTFKMLAGFKSQYIDELVNKLTKIDCDQYWIVSHNEGLRVAYELAKRQKRQVHMTVHDDWAGALCARSVRYRFMQSFAKKMTVKALKSVASFDVISTGMQAYYQQLSGLEGKICHRYLSADAVKAHAVTNENNEVTAGHIGSVYDRADLVTFIKAFSEYFTAKGKKPVLKLWGCHLTVNDVPAHLHRYVQFHQTLPEEQVLPELSQCNFLYAMYPLNKSLRTFSKTSLPTKLTSYLQAGRPILGHGPAGSTLAQFLETTGLGVMWTSGKLAHGSNALEKIAGLHPDDSQLQNARTIYFGENNLHTMLSALNP